MRIAVADAQRAARAVLTGLGHVGAELLDHEPDPARGELRDPIPGLGEGAAVMVGTEQAIDQLCRGSDYADLACCSDEARG
jgi:hypothetical protein